MKPITVIVAIALAAALGCGQTRLNMVKDTPRAPTPQGVPSAEDVVAWLKTQGQNIQSVRSDELWLTVNADGQTFDISGKMMAQKPLGFRLKAKALGNDVVELGSNDQEFWYWIGKSPQPYQFFCSYKDLNEGKARQMPFPFQPEWIIETMGLGPYSPADRIQVEAEKDTLKLIERTRSPQGVPVRKVIVCRRTPVAPPQPQVIAYLLLDDATGKEICSAHITEVHKGHPTLPRNLELRWPEAKMKLKMKIDGLSVNPPLPPTAFVRQPMNGVQSFDLARGLVAQGTSLQQTRDRR